MDNKSVKRLLVISLLLATASLASCLPGGEPPDPPTLNPPELTAYIKTQDARMLTPNIFNTEAFGIFPTLTPAPTGGSQGGPTLSSQNLGATQTARSHHANQALQAFIVPNGPPDIPGWDGEYELELADETHLVYYLPEDWMYEKAPFVYLDLMPQYGWEPQYDWEASGQGLGQGDSTTMTFVKDNRTATIVFSIEPDRRVKVAIEITEQ